MTFDSDVLPCPHPAHSSASRSRARSSSRSLRCNFCVGEAPLRRKPAAARQFAMGHRTIRAARVCLCPPARQVGKYGILRPHAARMGHRRNARTLRLFRPVPLDLRQSVARSGNARNPCAAKAGRCKFHTMRTVAAAVPTAFPPTRSRVRPPGEATAARKGTRARPPNKPGAA